MWMLNFYQDIIEKKLHRLFAYDSDTNELSCQAIVELEKEKRKQTERDRMLRIINDNAESKRLALSNQIKCPGP